MNTKYKLNEKECLLNYKNKQKYITAGLQITEDRYVYLIKK